jgi:serine/threonine-protein kinase HipA
MTRPAAGQDWNADDYARHAGFVPALGTDVLALLAPRAGEDILDLGCGPGRQTLVLARTLRHSVIAVDTHRPYLERLARAADDAGLSSLIETRQQSFFNLPKEPGGVALIWAEGSIYVPGFVDGLRLWRPLLVPDGLLVASDVVWLTDDPPAEARTFWEQEECNPLVTLAERCAQAEAEGFAVLGTHALPTDAWWDEYYRPLADRSAALRPGAGPALTRVLDANDHEIDIWRRFGDSYGEVFFVLRKVPDAA